MVSSSMSSDPTHAAQLLTVCGSLQHPSQNLAGFHASRLARTLNPTPRAFADELTTKWIDQ